MRIPYVIDNVETRLADVLNYLLERHMGQQVEIATAAMRRVRRARGRWGYWGWCRTEYYEGNFDGQHAVTIHLYGES